MFLKRSGRQAGFVKTLSPVVLLIASFSPVIAQSHSSISSGAAASNSTGTLYSSIGQAIVPQSFASNGSSRLAEGFLAVPILPQTVTTGIDTSVTYGKSPDSISGASVCSSGDTSVLKIGTIGSGSSAKTVFRYVGSGSTKISASAPQQYLMAAASVSVPLSVAKAPLEISADTIQKKTGDADPPYVYSCNGFVNGEDTSVLSTRPSFSRVSGETEGTYTITPSGASAKNYDITYVDGALVISNTTEVIADSTPVNANMQGHSFVAVQNPVSRSSGRKFEFWVQAADEAKIKVQVCDPLGNALSGQEASTTNVGGQKIRRFTWDMRRSDGSIVSPGSFLAVASILNADGTHAVRKCMIVVTK